MNKLYILLTIAFLCFDTSVKARISTPIKNQNTSYFHNTDKVSSELFPKTSRSIHNFNMKLIYALKPALDEYKEQRFAPLHKGISNFLKNLEEPLNASNALLQLDFIGTTKIIGRFVINSTSGMFGFMDVAGAAGLKRDTRTFGQTLGVWGVPQGNFFVIPLFGQTTTRNLTGMIVDLLFNPLNSLIGWEPALFIDASVQVMGIYDSYDFVLSTHETSIDSYNTFKTMYLQHQEKLVDEHKLFNTDKKDDTNEDNNNNKSYKYDFDME